MNKLAQELVAAGAGADAESFREVLADVMFECYGSWTIDDLLCHPHDAIEFCELIRSRTKSRVSDYLILKTLLNMRKRGYM